MFTTVCKLVNMYIHVCSMFRHVCTNLPIPVQVVRIPDVIFLMIILSLGRPGGSSWRSVPQALATHWQARPSNRACRSATAVLAA